MEKAFNNSENTETLAPSQETFEDVANTDVNIEDQDIRIITDEDFALMEPPQVEYPEISENTKDRRIEQTTPNKLLSAVEMNIKMFIKNVNVSGLENLSEIPKNKNIVIVTTHASDLDVPLTIKALGKIFGLAVSDAATNHSFKNIGAKVGLMRAGEDNFIPIEYRNGKKDIEAGFNPDNFTPMVDALETGKAVIVAAHNPSRSDRLEKGGIGGVYLAQLSDAIIIPVSVNVKSEKTSSLKGFLKMVSGGGRKDADVVIGHPIELPEIEGIEDFKNIMNKRKSGEKLTSEEIDRFKQISSLLKEQSNSVMQNLASAMPDEKRGPYSKAA